MLHLKTAAGERLEIPAGCIIAVMRPCDGINPSAIMYDMGAGPAVDQLSDQYGFVLGGPTIGLPLGLLALATGWSRCYLGRHTPRQVALGLLSSLTLLLWLPA